MKDLTTSKLIHVIGTDAAGPENLQHHLQNLILDATAIAAPNRLLNEIPNWIRKKNNKAELPPLFESNKLDLFIQWLKKQNGDVVVLASGDPLWFGIGRRLLEEFPFKQLRFYPSPTSLQLAFARIGKPWQEANWISIHGRNPELLADKLKKRPKAIAILTDPENGTTEEIRKVLKALGLEKSYEFWIFERLGHPKERIKLITSKEAIPKDINPLHLVVLIEKKPSPKPSRELPVFGIEDGLFIQHTDFPGLMTKREIRVQLLSDLELPEQGVLWDIGAGVGSVGLEAIRIRPKLKLISVEKHFGSKKIIETNAKQLGVRPAAIFESEALGLLHSNQIPIELAKPNRVILGGGGSQREEILKIILTKLHTGGVIVVPLVTLESVGEIKSILEFTGCEISINQHQNWRGMPLLRGTRLSPMNPVFIIKGVLK